MDESIIIKGNKLVEDKTMLKNDLRDMRSDFNISAIQSTRIQVPRRLHEKLIALFESEIEEINKEIEEL